MLSKPGAALNRLTLCFLDPAEERDFRLQRAEASRAILRRFILFMVLLVTLVTTGIHRKLEVARAAGLPIPPQLDLGGDALLFAAGIGLLLFLGTLWRRFVPYLHTLTAVCMAGLVLIDISHARHIPIAYALNGTLLNLVVLYIAAQLRFVVASALGVAASLSYLCCITAHRASELETSPDLQLQVGVTITVLACANLLLMFVTHQRELSARLAYHRARLLEERSSELEAALKSLQQAELQLVENEKQATVGRLVAGILHEMNTPLGALSSSTQTLERGLERVRALLGSIEQGGPVPQSGARPDVRHQELSSTLTAAERLAAVQAASGKRIRDVIEGLRQFVALDRSELQLCDVRAGLQTAVALIRPGLPAGVALQLEVPAHPIWVQCFPGKLNQVFLNLLKNSVSSFEGRAPRGQIVVSARVAGGRTSLEVRDTGCGIAAERVPHLFDLDFTRRGSRVKLSLGLPSSRGVVEAIGGRIQIESQLDQGTSVLLDLPLGAPPFGAPLASPRPPEAAAPAAGAEAPSSVGMAARILPSL
jgi:signal transduction histidine kinase